MPQREGGIATGTGPGFDWRREVLRGLGLPVRDVAVLALTLWAASEGTPSSWHNPLATTIAGFGGRSVNPAGVKAYPTWQQGVAATVATLRLALYRGVVQALGSGTLLAIWTAINRSPWCRGCQQGRYPVALYTYLVAHGQRPQVSQPPSPPPAPPPPPPPSPEEASRQIEEAWGRLARAWTQEVPRLVARARLARDVARTL